MSELNNKAITVVGNVLKNIQGIDMQAPMKISFHRKGYMVFRRAGFTGRVSFGETGYYPPQYYLVSTTFRDGLLYIKEVIEVVEVNKATWLATKKRLCNRATNLSKGKLG